MILKVSTVALKEFLVPFTFKPKRILFLGSTEFEEPKDLRETKGTLVIFEKCWFLEFRIKSMICSIRNSRSLRNIISLMRNSRNQQFFIICQGFYGSSKILRFLEFRIKSTICSIRNSRNLRNILSFMRNSRNQQFFRIYQGFYGFSKILRFLEFRRPLDGV